MAEDKQEVKLPIRSNCGWVRALDSDGNSIKISKADLLNGLLSVYSHFEGDANELKKEGMYYTTGNTLNANNNIGLFIVFRSMESVAQLGFNVFNGAVCHRTLLWNNGKWDTWSEWKTL